MPVQKDKLESVLVAPETETVRQVVGTLLSGKPHTQSQWSTVVVRKGAGNFKALTLLELNDAADQLGPAILDKTLAELVAAQSPIHTVEWARTKNLRRAEDDARRAPGRRLLVLEDGEPLGLVTIKRRGMAKEATVVQFYKAQAGPDMKKLVDWGMRTCFLLLRPQVTLAEADRVLKQTQESQEPEQRPFAVVPLDEDQYILLNRNDLKPGLGKLGRYTLRQVYAAGRCGCDWVKASLVQASKVRPRQLPSNDAVVLHAGKAIGFFPGLKRSGGLTAKGQETSISTAAERVVNAWFQDHKSSLPLARGTQYNLGLNVGTQRADSYTVSETYRGPVDQDVHVGLVGDPDAWRIDGPTVQKLHIPAAGDSAPVFFQVTPLKQGQQQLVAHFYHRNHLIQTVEITGIQVAIPDAAGASAVPGQQPVAVTLTRSPADESASDRDANLYIEWLPTQGRYRFTFFSASPDTDGGGKPVLHSARIALTADEMGAMAAQARKTIETYLVGLKEAGTFPFQLLSEDKNRQPSDAAFQQAVFKLAQLGYGWFYRLFYQTQDPKLEPESRAMGELLLKASAGDRLHIQVVSSDFYLPWNLFYTHPSGELKPVVKKTADAEGIWGFRHVIEQVPARDLAHLGSSGAIDATAGLKVSANLNMNIDRTKYKPATEQREFFETQASDPQLKLELTTRLTEDEVLEAFQGDADAEHILYFYCHALTEGDPRTRYQESRLVLTQKAQSLQMIDLITGTMGLPPLSQAPLVFLNACGSAEMDAQFYASFVQFMRDRGARTVIGTLNDTPIYAGSEFGKKFFDRFLQGGPENSAARLLFELRRELLDVYRNPIGLSYALFYNGDVYVKRET